MVSYLKVGENIAQHITSKASRTMIEFNRKGLQALKKSEISADIEQAIDNIVYSLFGLNEDEIKIVEG